MIRLALILILLTGCSTLQPTHAEKMHIGAGAITGALTYSITGNPWHACTASLAIGIAKEAYDSTGRGHATTSDVLYTALPSCMLFFLLHRGLR